MATSAFLDSKTQQYAVFFLGWHNPYTSPPSDQPRILGGVCVPWPWPFWEEMDYNEIWNWLPKHPLGSGYAHCVSIDDIKPRKHWTPERMATNRLRLMKNRIRKKDPLFADQFIKKQIASKPDYYDPAAIANEIEERKAWHAQWEKDVLESWVVDTQPQKTKEKNHAAVST